MSSLESPRFGCRTGGRRCPKYKGFMRAMMGSTFRKERRALNLGRLYKLRQAWEKISHEQCGQSLRIRVPRIRKNKGSCSYLTVVYGCASLGADFDGMLDRACADEPGNPAWTAPTKRIAKSLKALLTSPDPVSIAAFREAVRATEEKLTGTNPLYIWLKVIRALKQEDRDRFTVLVDRAFVCPHDNCDWHEVVPSSAPSQEFFYYHQKDYDYTQPWWDVVGLPFNGLGPIGDKASARNGACNGCKGSLAGMGELPQKEKLKRPLRMGTAEKPTYILVHYRCPPEIETDGVLKVRPFLEQRFGAYRESPNNSPPRVFDTGCQQVFDLVGYGVVIPRTFDHVAWRTHNLADQRYVHFEADQYFGIDAADYLDGEQQIAFAIYRSRPDSHNDEQPPEHEDNWKELGYAAHKERVRAAKAPLEKRVTRSKMAEATDQPGTSGMQQKEKDSKAAASSMRKERQPK